MVLSVIKRDGIREYFDSDKMKESIITAAKSIKLSKERKKEAVEQVYNNVMNAIKEKEEVPTSEIRDKILQELEKIEPRVANAWKRYESETKGLIEEEQEEF